MLVNGRSGNQFWGSTLEAEFPLLLPPVPQTSALDKRDNSGPTASALSLDLSLPPTLPLCFLPVTCNSLELLVHFCVSATQADHKLPTGNGDGCLSIHVTPVPGMEPGT